MSKKKTIYIAGKMRGLYALGFKNFFLAQDYLERRGWKVINPAEMDVEHWVKEKTPRNWFECLRADLAAIEDQCDAIYMLNNWEDSNGAKRELAKAKKLGLEIIYQPKNGERR